MNSIRKKMYISVTTIILAVVIMIGSVASYLCYNATFNSLEQTMQEVAKKSAEVVSKELNTYKTIAEEVGLISRLSASDITSEEKDKIFEQRIQMHNLKRINTATKDGLVVSTKTGTSEVIKHLDYFEASINGDVFVTDPLFDGETFEMYYIVSAPLWKDGIYGSSIEGIVMLEIDGKVISDIASGVVVGEKGFGSIIDDEGYIIGHPDYSKVLGMENAILKYEADGSGEDLAMLEQGMLSGSTNFGTYKNGREKNLLSYAPIEGTEGWGMLVVTPQKEYMNSTYFSIIVTVALAVLSIVISVVVVFKISDKITSPIIACANRLKLLSEGDLHTEVPKTKSKDETGVLLNSLEITINEINDIINDISYHLGTIAGGDLTRHIEKNYVGDFEPIEQSLIKILQSLNYIFKGIGESTEQVASGAQQVAAGAQVLTEGATEQAGSIEELAATINEIYERTIANNENAQNGKKISEEASMEVQNGTEHMNHMIEAMSDISESSAQIGRIIKAIEDIAFQTNILALNAAVEAARAGSAGKGFAVVAEEVRNLASKSAEAAGDTTQLIENSMKTIKRGTDIADVTLKAFNSIVEKANITVSIVEEIAEASKQQAMAASQINSGIDQISSVVQTNSATAEESAAASEELSSQAVCLRDILSKITVKHSSVKETAENKCCEIDDEDNATYEVSEADEAEVDEIKENSQKPENAGGNL